MTYSALRHFVHSVVPLSERSTVLLAVFMAEEFTAYFDESETQSVALSTGKMQIPRDKRAVVIAGFLATAQQWERLEKDWNYIFEQHDLPKGAVFHMVDFVHNADAFKVFRGKTSEQQQFLSQLIGLLNIRVRHSIVRSLLLKYYDDLDSKLCLKEKASPYTLCALAAIEGTVKYAKHYGANVKVIFEDGFPTPGQLVDMAARDGFPKPSFELKGQWRALQAADMVAWESQKVWKKVLEQEAPPVRESMKAIARIHNDWADYLPGNLLNSAQHLGCKPRSSSASF
jgi:hypothetical protein